MRQHAIPVALVGTLLLMVALTSIKATVYDGTLMGEPWIVTTGNVGDYLRIPLPNPLYSFITTISWHFIGGTWAKVLGIALVAPAAYGLGILLNRMVARLGAWKTIVAYVIASLAAAVAEAYWFFNIYL